MAYRKAKLWLMNWVLRCLRLLGMVFITGCLLDHAFQSSEVEQAMSHYAASLEEFQGVQVVSSSCLTSLH